MDSIIEIHVTPYDVIRITAEGELMVELASTWESMIRKQLEMIEGFE